MAAGEHICYNAERPGTIMTDYQVQRRLLALCAIPGIDWYVLAREAQRAMGLGALERGQLTEQSKAAKEAARLILASAECREQRLDQVNEECTRAFDAGADLMTVLDDNYPANLRLVHNLPPFLFVRGTLESKDSLSVCVVGTRQATSSGLRQASGIAAQLAKRDVTVVAGLARGIDTSAHRAALNTGGRTIAVIGTGILNCYPKENLDLSERIAGQGALVSQFMPSSPPRRSHFPVRNITMSGIAQGTIVVEASATSGAKMQARLAIEHGKQVFLMRSLVTLQPWAQDYLKRPRVFEISGIQDILPRLSSAERVSSRSAARRQLSFDLSA